MHPAPSANAGSDVALETNNQSLSDAEMHEVDVSAVVKDQTQALP